MRKMLISRKTLLTILIIMILCTGCNNDKSNDIQDKLSAVEDENVSAGSATSTDAQATYTYPETVYYVSNANVAGEQKSIIDAKVIAETTEDIGVYGLSFVPIDDELVKGYADKLFDNSEYQVIKPFDICNEEELYAEREHAVGLIEYYGGESRAGQKYYKLPCCTIPYAPEDVVNSIDYELSKYEESNFVELSDSQLLYKETRESYQDTPDDSFSTRKSKTRLRGKVDGEEWDMTVQYVEPTGGVPYGVISMSNVYSDSIVHGYEMINERTTMFYGENIVDEEEARRDALDALKNLGFEEIDNIYTYCVMTSDYYTIRDGEAVYGPQKANGYCFIFAKRYGNLDVGYVAHGYNDLKMTQVYGEELGNFQEYIYVTVTDDGIYNISFSTGYQVIEKLSDDSILMDFDYINDMAIKYVDERPIIDNDIGTIELKYIATYYEGEGYALVPVWVYYFSMDINKTTYYGEPCARFGVNALDGSIVDFIWTEDPFDIDLY